MRRPLGTLGLVLSVAILPGPGHAPPQPIVALAPVEIPIDGRSNLVGVAVNETGTAYVSDRASGHVYRLEPSGTVAVAAQNLDRPVGLAFDPEGRLLIAEERAGRIVRLEPGRPLTVLASGIRSPRWIAAAPSGAVYVSAHRLMSPDGHDPEEGREIVLVQPDGHVTVVAAGIRRLESLILLADAVVAATMGLESGPDGAGALLRFPLAAGGALGPAEHWLGTGLNQPVGLAEDVLGALYVSSHMITDIPERARRAIGKVHPDVRLSAFAENLENPQGVALGPDGSLYVADGRSGRLLRFRAPPEPALAPLPPFVTQASVEISGTATAGARVDVATEEDGLLATAAADTAGGFSMPVPLAPNRVNELLVLATSHGGDGLTGPAAAVDVTHDDRAPTVTLLEPPGGAFLRQTVTVRAAAMDSGSGVASVAIAFRGQTLAAVGNPDPEQPLIATVSLDTSGHPDGTHPLTAVAEDRAGNAASTSQTVIVDNTPPETEITGGPTGAVPAGPVTFTFTGTDNLTPTGSLAFAWRLDGGGWSPFLAQTTATLEGLAHGAHLFEVRARDLAGNEDPTPVSRSFTVGAGLQIAIAAPADGASLPEGPTLVRGSVAAGGQEVAVTVNGVPAAVHGGVFAAMVRTEPGPLVVSAVATTPSGARAEDSVAVVVTESTHPLLDLQVSPASGVAPLAVAFSLPGVAGVVGLDADGDGSAEFTGPALDGHVHTYTAPGLYLARATVTDALGNRLVQHAVVEVLDAAAVDAFFRARWAGLRDGLGRADVEGALAVVAEGQREKYRGALQVLVPDLPAIAGGLSDMTVLSFGEHVVEGLVTRVRDGVTHLHFVYFMRDDDGLWKIVEM